MRNKTGNIARDLMRKMMKGSKWPLFYWAKVPVLCKQTDTVVEVGFPFLLPNEAIAAMAA